MKPAAKSPHRYVRPPKPLRFRCDWESPVSSRHNDIRTHLWQCVRDNVGDRADVGCNQAVYWDGSDPTKWCVPELYVTLGSRQNNVDCWKTWERGTPQLAVQFVREPTIPDRPWDETFACYLGLGVKELVRFDLNDTEAPLRIWDRVEDDLVERDRADPAFSRCDTLDAYYCIVPDPEMGPTLRMSSDAEGRELWPHPVERLQAERRDIEACSRAEERIREFEAELARRDRR